MNSKLNGLLEESQSPSRNFLEELLGGGGESKGTPEVILEGSAETILEDFLEESQIFTENPRTENWRNPTNSQRNS